MQANKPTKRLGRGLDSLISRVPVEPAGRAEQPQQVPQRAPMAAPLPQADSSAAMVDGVQAAMVPVDLITANPFQPRQKFGDSDLAQLSESIRTNGFVQPIVVRKKEKGGYQIVAGERRWRAAKRLNMTSVPVLIRDASDEQMVELALVENIQREDLNPIDRAKAYRAFADRFSFNADQIATRLGEDRTTVSNYLRLLDLQSSLHEMVADRKLSMGHARCLLGVHNPKRQLELAESVARNELSVRALEELVRREKLSTSSGDPAETSKPTPRVRSAHLKDMEQRFERAVKTGVTIHEGKRRGTGRITIEYYSLHDFERIAEKLGVQLD